MKKIKSYIRFNISSKKFPDMPLSNNYEVRWKNFKGFKDTGWIKIKPITIIIGTNNSGKTSFVSPLLLMNQTITSTDPATTLIINGKIYDGGNIKELHHNYDLKNDIFFGFRYYNKELTKETKEVGFYPPGGIEITFEVNNEKDREISVKSESIFDIYNRLLLKISKTIKGHYQINGIDKTGLTNEEKIAIKNSRPLNFLFSPNSLLHGLGDALDTRKKENKGALSKPFSLLLRIISTNFTMVRNILGDVSYIGPIREKPKRYYQLKNQDYHTVGTGGENVPDLINKNPQIKQGLNSWVKKFNFGDSIELKKLGNSICSIQFHKKGVTTYTNIANAGFGASQILPLITQALVSDEESLTIAEQPEIHLNPKLQGTLAELFVFMAKEDQRVIVETHSEHLLMRLRRLVAEGEIETDQIAIYFVEKENSESKIRTINMDKNGAISSDEWPIGFFGESLTESLALTAQQQKNRKK